VASNEAPLFHVVDPLPSMESPPCECMAYDLELYATRVLSRLNDGPKTLAELGVTVGVIKGDVPQRPRASKVQR